MEKHGWIVSSEAYVETQGTIHHGILETLVLIETETVHAATLHLPFTAEPYASWGDDVDVRSFLFSISDDVSTVINFEGTATTSRKGKDIEEEWPEDLKLVAENLRRFVDQQLGKAEYDKLNLEPSWPRDDITLGHAMKYVMAWRAVDREALEESRFFSIAHLLEATNEIESSLALAQGGFYKQAKQQLRSLLELVVMPLHFCIDRVSFREWIDGNYRTPRFRGSGGLLELLVARSLLPRQTANEIGNLYGRLSGSIHNEERELAFAGVLGGRSPVIGFSIERLHEWADLCVATLDAAIRAAVATMDAWDANRPADPFCATCHNETEFSIIAERFGQELYDKITCTRCDTTIVRPFRLADPRTEVEPIIPGVKFRLLSPIEVSRRESQLSLNLRADNGGYSHHVNMGELRMSKATGRPVTALCGWTWVPNKSAEDFPDCPSCESALGELTD